MTQRGLLDPLLWLWRHAGLRFGGVIDVGCADGHFGLVLAELGPARRAAILNVDAQDDYRESLEAIRSGLGAHYRICAVGDQDGGTITLNRGEHAYWSSVRPGNDPYWAGLNDLRGGTATVPLRTIDALVNETGLPGPYLLKLDIQGAEAAALAGASRTLANTDVVVVEMMVSDFAAIHARLDAAGFLVFDLVDMEYSGAGVLGWFYAVYLHSRHAARRPDALWDPQHNAQVIATQRERRDTVRKQIAASLQRFREGRWKDVPS